jgi:gamma-glutamyl-gamma-aminobutyrate hydrolase PuuD
MIEEIDPPSEKFILRVQWRPGGTWKEDPYPRKLFRGLVQVAIQRRRKR